MSYLIHEYEHDAANTSFGEEAADKLGVEPARVFKTLVCVLPNGHFACGIVPVVNQLDLKAMASALGEKSIELASVPDAERVTGYVRGGVSPIGQKRQLKTIIDESATSFDTIYVSGGKRGMDIKLAPCDLITLVDGSVAPIGK